MSSIINNSHILIATLIVLLGWSSAGADVSVRRIEAPPITAAEITLDATTAKIAATDGSSESREIPREHLISFDFHNSDAHPPEGSLLEFANGDRLIATILEIDDGAVLARINKHEIQVPLEQLRGIVWNASKTDADWWPLLFRERGADDLIILTNGDRSGGTFTGMSKSNITLVLDERTLTIPRERIAAIAFSPELISIPESPAKRQIVLGPAGWLTVTGLHGSTADALKGNTLFGETITFPPRGINQIQFLGPRVVSLTDMKPTTIEFTPWLSRPWPIQRNRSVMNHPLELEGRTYARGIGVHSQTRITYPLGGKFDRFSVTAGLANSAGSQGNVAIAVEVDGRTVERREGVSRASGPVAFDELSVTDGKTLSLIVDFGANGDIRDRVNWCAPTLIRDTKMGQ